MIDDVMTDDTNEPKRYIYDSFYDTACVIGL